MKQKDLDAFTAICVALECIDDKDRARVLAAVITLYGTVKEVTERLTSTTLRP